MKEHTLPIIATVALGISLAVFARESTDKQRPTDHEQSQSILLEAVLPLSLEIKKAIPERILKVRRD